MSQMMVKLTPKTGKIWNTNQLLGQNKGPILDANLRFQSCNRKYPLYSVIRRDCGNAKNMAAEKMAE